MGILVNFVFVGTIETAREQVKFQLIVIITELQKKQGGRVEGLIRMKREKVYYAVSVVFSVIRIS